MGNALDNPEKRGKLKIFFGYAAGVGKTYGMLKAAHEDKADGVDVVLGYIEPHTRPATLALLEGLEQLPVAQVEYKGVTLREFDIDAALKRKPELILVDELAHTNAPGSRHLKRYQDVEELLNAGIDVYTTVNVQHMESINDVVESITGVAVRERIPDYIFNEADHVELMDIEPEELIERLGRGEVYKEAQAQKALQNFFTPENLIALREMSLRRTADHVNIAAMKGKTQPEGSPYIAGEHVLICLSSSPSNAKVVRTAARMAEAFHCPFTALFVETEAFENMSKDDAARLRDNTKLAGQLGAKIVTVFGNDIPELVSEYAKLNNITKIVMGRSGRPPLWPFGPSYMDKLSALAPEVEIFIIPSKDAAPAAKRAAKFAVPKITLKDSAKSVAILALSTLIGFLFDGLDFSDANIITVYILGVLITAAVTEGKIYSTVSSVLAVLAFNYFFTDPRLSLEVYNPGYPLTFLVMFISAFLTSTLTNRAEQQTRASSMKAYRTEILLETSLKLQHAKSGPQVFEVVARQIMKLLDRTVVVYPIKNGGLGEPLVMAPDQDAAGGDNINAGDGIAAKTAGAGPAPALADAGDHPEQPSDRSKQDILSRHERAVAEWAYKNNKDAGATTNTLPSSICQYLPIANDNAVFAVIGVEMSNNPKMGAFEKSLLMAMLSECALAIEKQVTAETNQDILLRSKQEQLRANLLRAISHDLRTPLAGILGTSEMIMSMSKDGEQVKKLAGDIRREADWLHALVENILNLTRLQDGKLALSKEPEAVEEIIGFAVSSVSNRYPDVEISASVPEELLVVPMDARLISQTLINLLDNAARHSRNKSGITVSVSRENNAARFAVADSGVGIREDLLPHIFEAFRTGAEDRADADARQGIGLGLTICEAIVKAHGGELKARNKTGAPGAEFVFTIPLGAVGS